MAQELKNNNTDINQTNHCSQRYIKNHSQCVSDSLEKEEEAINTINKATYTQIYFVTVSKQSSNRSCHIKKLIMRLYEIRYLWEKDANATTL